MEFVVAMVTLAKVDRDAYRLLRAEAWDMAAANHARKSAAEREIWARSAS